MNSSLETSPCSITYDPGGYQRSCAWSRMKPIVPASSAISSSEWTKSMVPANRPRRVVSQVASRFMSSTSWGGK